MGLTVLAGAALFAAPLLIWWRYSAEIASDGGLYAFVERAAGRRVALVQGCIWTFSYFLYLPFTVTYLVYDQLPESFPGIVPHQRLLELALPIAIAGALLAAERLVFVLVAVVAVVQVALTVVLAVVIAEHAGVHPGAFRLHSNGPSVARGHRQRVAALHLRKPAALPRRRGLRRRAHRCGGRSSQPSSSRRVLIVAVCRADGGARRLAARGARGAGLHAREGVRGQRPCHRDRASAPRRASSR